MDEIILLNTLDEVLKLLKSPRELGGLSYDNIVNHFDDDHTSNFGHNAIAILKKLEDDKLIFKHDNETYHITIEGRLYHGYVDQEANRVRQQNEIKALSTLETRLKEKVVVQNRWLIGIGLIAAFYYLIEITKIVFHHCH